MRIIIETRLLRYVSEWLLFTSKHIKEKLLKTKEMCGTGSLNHPTYFIFLLFRAPVNRARVGNSFFVYPATGYNQLLEFIGANLEPKVTAIGYN